MPTENMEVDNPTTASLLKEKKLEKLCNGNGIEVDGGEDSMDKTEKSEDMNGIDESAKNGKLNSVRENGDKGLEKKIDSNEECQTNGEDKENDVDHEIENKIEVGTEEGEKDDDSHQDSNEIEDGDDKNIMEEAKSDKEEENSDISGSDTAGRERVNDEEKLHENAEKKNIEYEDNGPPDSEKETSKNQSHESIVVISEDDKTKTNENTEDESGAGKESKDEDEKVKSDAGKEENASKDSDAKSNKEEGTKDIDLTSPTKTSQPALVKPSPPKPSNVTTALKPPAPSIQIRPMASLLFDVGMDLARQQVYKDLIRIQTKKLSMDKLDDKEGKQLDKLKEAYDELVSKNEPFATDYNQCDICGYKSELDNVLENHKEYGHGQNINMFHCTLCDFETKVQHQFILHMEHNHKRRGRVVVRHAFFVCPFCPFEHNAKNSYNKHILKCERLFKMNRNLEPTPADCDIPIKLPKPVESRTMPTRNQPRQPQPHISQVGRRGGNIPVAPTPVRPAANTVAAAQQALQQSLQAARSLMRPPQAQPVAPVAQPAPQMVQVGNQWYHMILLNGQRFLTPVVPGVPAPNLTVPNVMNNAQILRQQVPQQPPRFSNKANNVKKTPNASAFEICEICGGFVKDRDSLRIHFYWAHKVDIHKDMFLRSRPNLVCERCDFRCWTVQGLARHKNTAHKEHTKDKGKARPPFYCMLCRPTPELLHTETFWLHMSANHSVNPANIFNQDHCVVCGVANIGVPRALETHMLNIHGHLFTDELVTLARKIAEAGSPKALMDTMAASRQSSEGSSKKFKEKHTKEIPECPTCEATFSTMGEYTSHCQSLHQFKCSRCSMKYSSRLEVQKHFSDTHKNEKDSCSICDKTIQIGRPLVRHMKSEHMKDCSVVIPKLPQSEVDKRMDKYIDQWGTPGKLKTPAKPKRKRSTENPVIVLDETPQKKRRRSSTSSKQSTTEQEVKSSNKTSTTKEVIEVDGEEILVEIQQSDDEADTSLETSTNSKSTPQENTENVQEISDSSANSSGIIVEENSKSDTSEILIDEQEDGKSNSENNEENNSEKTDKELGKGKDSDKKNATEADEPMDVADD